MVKVEPLPGFEVIERFALGRDPRCDSRRSEGLFQPVAFEGPGLGEGQGNPVEVGCREWRRASGEAMPSREYEPGSDLEERFRLDAGLRAQDGDSGVGASIGDQWLGSLYLHQSDLDLRSYPS